VGNFGRYLFPLLPFIILLGMLAVEPAWHRLARLRLPAALPGTLKPVLGGLLLLLPTLFSLAQGATLHGRCVANIQDGDVRMAHWLADSIPPDALVAVQDIGAIGYFAPQRLLDLSALITPELRGYVGREGIPGLWRFLEEERPDLVVAFPQWAPPLTQDPERLRPIFRMDVPDNIALGGDTLIVYITPWSRIRLGPPAPPPPS
jgi:hypothetical protein